MEDFTPIAFNKFEIDKTNNVDKLIFHCLSTNIILNIGDVIENKRIKIKQIVKKIENQIFLVMLESYE